MASRDNNVKKSRKGSPNRVAPGYKDKGAQSSNNTFQMKPISQISSIHGSNPNSSSGQIRVGTTISNHTQPLRGPSTNSERMSLMSKRPKMQASESKYINKTNIQKTHAKRQSPKNQYKNNKPKKTTADLFDNFDSIGDEHTVNDIGMSINDTTDLVNRTRDSKEVEMRDTSRYFNDRDSDHDDNFKGSFRNSTANQFLSSQESNKSKTNIIERIEKSLVDLKGDEDYHLMQSSERQIAEVKLGHDYKDNLLQKHVAAYAVGHLANDLIINMWNTYSPWYLNRCVGLTDHEAGLVVMVGQIVDAIAQPLIGYGSDNIDTKYGKRMPWYLFGHLCTLPCFYLVFNPPDAALDDGSSKTHATPSLLYFIVVPSIMNIGQGAVQLSHMSIVNSITYDQKRRDGMINYRNSTAYFAGILVPAISFIMFSYVNDNNDQFSYMSWVCIVVGTMAFLFFVLVINEPYLVDTSKEIYDKFFMIKEDDVGSDGVILDMDAVDSASSDGNVFGQQASESAQSSEKNYLDLSNNNIQEYFENANARAKQRTDYSRGRRTEIQQRCVTPTISRRGNVFDRNTDLLLFGQENKMAIEMKLVQQKGGDVDSVVDLDQYYQTNQSDQQHLKKLKKDHQGKQGSSKKKKVHILNNSNSSESEKVPFNIADRIQSKKASSKKEKMKKDQKFGQKRRQHQSMAIQNQRECDALSEFNVRNRFQRQNLRQVEETDSMDSFSNDSSIMQIQPDKTANPAPLVDTSSVFFWFRRSDFYVTGLNFVFCRIALICQGTSLPYYLAEVMRLKSGDPNHTPYQMALAPAVTFAASLAWSVFLMGKIQRWHEFEQFVLFLYSVLLFAVAGVVLYFFINGYTPFEATIFYSALVLQGAALANQLNASASMISEMIGQDDAASAIVFATFNIIESFSVGGTVFIIMSYSLVDEKEYLKIIIAIVPCLCAICQYIISRWRFKNRADQQYGYETAQSGDAGYNSIARAFSVRSNRARPEDGRSGR